MTRAAHDLRDRIAQRAAALLAARLEKDMDAALVRAARELEAPRGSPMPSASLVRQHAQGIMMQALGQRGYEAAVLAQLQHAARVMQAIEDTLHVPTLLTGRAARGQTDGDPTMHVRAYTRAPVSHLAQVLVSAGLPEPTLRTIETRYGRANQLRFDFPDASVLVLRCMPEWLSNASTDLVTGRHVATQTLAQLLANPGRPETTLP